MRRNIIAAASIAAMLASPAVAEPTMQTVNGYLTSTGCAAGENIPCFRAYSSSTPAYVGGGASQNFTATIANGASLSSVVDLGTTRLFAIQMDPSAWTAAALTFQVSVDGTNYYSLYDSYGAEVSWTVAATTTVLNALPAQWLGIRYLKLRSGTAASAVNQAGARTLTVIGVP